jgi:hypothetical protein
MEQRDISFLLSDLIKYETASWNSTEANVPSGVAVGSRIPLKFIYSLAALT